MNRRLAFLSVGFAALAAAAGRGFATSTEKMKFEIEKPEAEWKAQLSPAAYAVLREHDTERPWTSALLEEHRKGTFNCAGCDLPLFAAETKFDSGTGWPSFYDHLPKAIGRTQDDTLFMTRIEVHCARCGGHQGHVFEDGPQPTGLRYCINGVALSFKPVEA